MQAEQNFKAEYKKLNREQKEAVDSIDGPVMVVAGPGTGKTQILALRIGNILLKTDTKADEILCLTFTNSAVRAMKERLRRYIGTEAGRVNVLTFHGFGMEMIEKYHGVLGLDEAPGLMDEKDSIALSDEILENNSWEYLRPRGDTSRYFRDLKNLISFLKRERVSPEKFEGEIFQEIRKLENDPQSISSRGESKGKLKKEIEKKVEALQRTREAVRFFKEYEKIKKEKNLFDFDDILEAMVFIAEESEDAQNFIKENYLYVLIDEHQDSSGTQNEFLEKIWKKEEKPNLFVVGDDRQLIYGFGGASLEYFENFKHAFGKAKLIVLTQNYRSTQQILDAAHTLLESSIAEGILKSNKKENYPVRLVEAYYPRDEILFCALEIKDKLFKKADSNDMAILVPKNRQVASAVSQLRSLGIPVSGGEAVNFFDVPEATFFLTVLKIIAYPNDEVAFGASFFSSMSSIPPLKAHKFFQSNRGELSLLKITEEKESLFEEENEINTWLRKLKAWLSISNEPLYSLVQKVGSELLLEGVQNHQDLVVRVEVIRTALHLVLLMLERDPKATLSSFVQFLERMENYGEKMPLAIFAPNEGVKVLTLHGSKGLEFDYVWVAHMDDKSFTSGKKESFALPESLKEKIEKRDELAQKRELYVAITRAKRYCTISYSLFSYSGREQELSGVAQDIAGGFEKQTAVETEKIILANSPEAYVLHEKEKKLAIKVPELQNIVATDYKDRKVSVSLLNNFFECPWKWYFRNLLQLPEPRSESLEFGNIIHGSIDAIIKSKKLPSSEDLDEIITEQIKKSGFGDERKQKKLFAIARKIISSWSEKRLPAISKNRENEQAVSLKDEKFPHLAIYGKIDLIEILGDGDLRVTDFKTGTPRNKSDIEKLDEEGRMSGYMRQLVMYSYLLKESKWKKDVKESCLEFVEAKKDSDSFYSTYVHEDMIKMLVKDIEDYDTMAKTGEWINRPCRFNSYGKANAICEYCQLSKIYTN